MLSYPITDRNCVAEWKRWQGGVVMKWWSGGSKKEKKIWNINEKIEQRTSSTSTTTAKLVKYSEWTRNVQVDANEHFLGTFNLCERNKHEPLQKFTWIPDLMYLHEKIIFCRSFAQEWIFSLLFFSFEFVRARALSRISKEF